MEGFPLEINIGDVAPRVRSAKRAIAGSGSKFGRLSDPQGVAVDQDGNVIVSDSRNHRLQVCAFLSVMISTPLQVHPVVLDTSGLKTSTTTSTRFSQY